MSSANKNGSNRRFSHDILFFEDTHEYLVDGKPAPSVTEILSPLHRSYAKVNPSVLDAMRYICFCEPKKILSFDIKTENLMKLADITEAYLTTQLERGFSTLDFYKSLMI